MTPVRYNQNSTVHGTDNATVGETAIFELDAFVKAIEVACHLVTDELVDTAVPVNVYGVGLRSAMAVPRI